MRGSNVARPLASLIVILLLPFISLAVAATNITSGTFEVDVLFPRNDTYAPQAFMPFVFALQKPVFIDNLGATLYWGIWPGTNRTVNGFDFNGVYQPNSVQFPPNLYTDQPLYVTYNVNTQGFSDGPWTFSWVVYVNNCSMQSDLVQRNGSLIFTTSKNGKVPDLVAATSPDTCHSAPAYAFDVRSVNSSPCGVLGPYVPSAANPCAASINAAAASSIQATATANPCAPGPPPESSNGACPIPTEKPSEPESGCAVTAPGLYIALVVAAAVVLVA